MSKCTISVIIPVYNGEEYLAECLDSVLNQTYKNLQILCINDGSTDNSLNILNDYATKDSRFEVITKANGGLSHTRNTGIAAAKGKYILFLDCDDMLIPEALSLLVEQAERQQLDVIYFDGDVLCSPSEADSEEIQRYKQLYYCKTSVSGVLQGPLMFRTLFEAQSYRASACLQMLRKDYLQANRLNFREGIFYEDNIFTLKSMLMAERTGYHHRRLYMRRIHEGSIVTSRKDYRHLRSYVIAANEIRNFAFANSFSSEVAAGIAAQVRSLQAHADQVYAALSIEERENAQQNDPLYHLVTIMVCQDVPSGILKKIAVKIRNAIVMLQTQGLRAVIKRIIGPRNVMRLKKLRGRDTAEPQGCSVYVPTANLVVYTSAPFDAQTPFVSVVLPVYNGQDYLQTTISSLQAQTLKNTEFIFVDDGSTDGSVAMLERAMQTDERIRLIRQTNTNAGAARNNGLANTRGKYVVFLDSDDTFHPDLLAHAYDRAEAFQAQVVCYDADVCRHPDMTIETPAWLQHSRQLPTELFSAQQKPDHIFQLLNPWTHFYLRKYIQEQGFQYQSQYATNDAHFTMMAMACAERIITLPEILVHYHIGRSGNIQSRKSKYPLTVFNAFSQTFAELKNRGALAAVECELVSKAMESVLRELETLRTEESRQILFDRLHNGGMKELGLDYLIANPKAQSRLGRDKVKRCKQIVRMSWDEFSKTCLPMD
ncbi:MAG: glycosyltransferase [Clostridia bacterium]|nr:glycosyltransferase [Clostridia bacterium]